MPPARLWPVNDSYSTTDYSQPIYYFHRYNVCATCCDGRFICYPWAKKVISAGGLNLFETPARYQMYHALTLLAVGVISLFPHFSVRWLKCAAYAFTFGIIVFSESLYLLTFSNSKWFSALTPLSGLAFLLGWFALAIASLKWHSEQQR